MENSSRSRLVLVFSVCVFLLTGADAQNRTHFFGRKSFPPNFVFALGSAAYQFEGAAREDGRGPSVWDTFSRIPGKILDESNGDIAVDQYHRYKEDIQLLVDLGVDSYRFSISWSRIFPKGRGAINKKGVAYYNNLIDELLKHGIKPFVTIYHWDIPQLLQDEYGGFLSEKVVKDFTAYANTCFELFGDRVKDWVTINELFSMSVFGYNSGTQAPGRCSKNVGNCSAGNSATEPYIVAHNLLLSHASAVKLYRDKYQKKQKGSIGITLVTNWFIPYTNSVSDEKATRRVLDFFFGWYMDPLSKGKYPNIMRTLLGARLPRFTKAQSQLVKGSFDFLGLNYYTAQYVKDASSTPINPITTNFYADLLATLTNDRNGVLIGAEAGSSWLHVYPQGIRGLLNYIKYKYNNPPVYITENGIDETNNASMPLKESLNDTWRIDFHSKHFLNLLRAIRDGCNVRGYYGWNFMDDFEWDGGYTVRFGFYFVDRNRNLTRYPKASAYWLKSFLHN